MKSEISNRNQLEEFISFQKMLHHLLIVRLHICSHCRFIYLVLLRKKNLEVCKYITSFLTWNVKWYLKMGFRFEYCYPSWCKPLVFQLLSTVKKRSNIFSICFDRVVLRTKLRQYTWKGFEIINHHLSVGSSSLPNFLHFSEFRKSQSKCMTQCPLKRVGGILNLSQRLWNSLVNFPPKSKSYGY